RLAFERLPGLVEEPHVLDRDYGLVGEGLHETDLSRREGAHFIAQHRDHANRFALAQQGYVQHRTEPVPRLDVAYVGVFGFDQRNEILDVDHAALERRAAADRGPAE